MDAFSASAAEPGARRVSASYASTSTIVPADAVDEEGDADQHRRDLVDAPREELAAQHL